MSRVIGRSHAAHERLVRLAAVVAVLAGLLLALDFQCADGMSMNASTHTSTVLDRASAGTATAIEVHVAEPVVLAAEGEHRTGRTTSAIAEVLTPEAHGAAGSPGTRDLLTTCLTLVVALTATIVVPRSPWRTSIVRVLDRARGTVVRAARPCALSLSELCLLRM